MLVVKTPFAGSKFAVFHNYYEPGDLVSLFKKVHAALLPGGCMVLNELVADEGRCEREKPLLVAMWLYCVTAQGDIYTLSELECLLKAAGFVRVCQAGEMRGEGEMYIRALEA